MPVKGTIISSFAGLSEDSGSVQFSFASACWIQLSFQHGLVRLANLGGVYWFNSNPDLRGIFPEQSELLWGRVSWV
jgi:hypothetical protein